MPEPLRGNGKPVGSVLVVGGGVGGMQASLDLADAGFRVYLAEKESSIGGTMAQLDKTFPSNDCAMCILAPKLVAVGRHLNVEILPQTDLLRLEGEAGRFTATLRRRATYIDPGRCTGCGECVEACPVELPNEFNLRMGTRKAVSRRYPQAVPAQFAISKRERAPCTWACTAGANVQAYLALTSRGKFAEALRVLRERMPFASVCGRICLHRCEQECNRNRVDEPLAVMNVKRFLADWDAERGEPLPRPVEKTRPERIAVVGGGPAGLTCAHDLALLGYPVTLFEAEAELGGMIRSCIPRFRLPDAAVQRDIAFLLSPGFEVRTNSRLGHDFTLADLETQGFEAVFLATGAHHPRGLPIPGHDLKGITLNLDFLRAARSGRALDVTGKVLVLGGGNVAMDVARTVRRLGIKEVTMACLESRATMPSHPWEIAEALEEGISIVNDVTFKRYVGKEGRVVGVEARRIRSMAFDAEGRLTVDEIAGSDFVLPADRVIVAIGQGANLSYLKPDDPIGKTRRGLLSVDRGTLAALPPATGETRPGKLRVFAGGDAVTGTAFVVDAVAAGHRGAESIDRSIRGEPLAAAPRPEPFRLTPAEAQAKLRTGEIHPAARVPMPRPPLEESLRSFEETTLGYTEAMAVAEAHRCLNCGWCSECMQCVAACQAHAIRHDAPAEETKNLEVGAVLFATGLEPFDPASKPEYGYRRYPNVVTSVEFERILSPTGPTAGKVHRPSDGTPPKKIAFLQCVGSREVGRNFCSSVCCMYTAKQAVIAKEHQPGVESTVFYIDLRAMSKGFEAYVDRAKSEGVRYLRCRPSAVREVHGSRDLTLDFVDDEGAPRRETFNLVVLAVGMAPPASTRRLSEALGVELDDNGFVRTPDFDPVSTSRPGVYACGSPTDPADIPETVAAASAAAARAMVLLSEARGTLAKSKVVPPERDARGKDPRVGVFVCHCGTNIAGVVDVEQVVQYAKSLPNVVHAERNLYTCSDDTQKRIREKVAELDLNRVVVASCTPRTHEPLFRDTLEEAGLNPYYFELANIRDQCSWVHMHEPAKATEKAKDLVRMAVAKVRLDEPLHKRPLAVTQAALVLGGGPSGLEAALDLADQGFQVHLVERGSDLGGHARTLRGMPDGEDPRRRLGSLAARALAHPRIEVHLNTELASIQGSLGNFRSTLAHGDTHQEVAHGIIVVATGAQGLHPDAFLYGRDPRVLLNRELEGKLADGTFRGKSVVFLQCVGSRSPERPYCSRTCCTETMKNAIRLKTEDPTRSVTVLYRDVRTYGLRESLYRAAREKGVRFVRVPRDPPPSVTAHDGGLRVEARDEMTHAPLLLEADAVVLAAATLPNPTNKDLAQLLKVPLNQEGFFLEAHRKLRPIDFSTDGIFLCGTAHSPMGLREAMAQAAGTAARGATILSRPTIDLEPTISHVVAERCDGCAYCVDPCPFKAITLVEVQVDGQTKKQVRVDEALCKGCGTCQATCPKGAIFVWHFRPEQLLAQVHAALKVETPVHA